MLVVKENGRLSDERSRTTSVWIASFVFFLSIPLLPFVGVVVSPATPPLPFVLLVLLVPQKSRSSNGGPDERRSFTHPEHQGNNNKLTTNKRSNFTEHHLSVCLSFFLSFLQDFFKTSCKKDSLAAAAAAAAVIVVVCSLLPFKNWILGCVWGFQDSVTRP
jgi:hypothetical protein